MEPFTIAFFGISGSGKGTQCDLLEKHLRDNDPSRAIVRPEMGNLLRAFMQTGTSLAKRTGDIVTAGGLVPSFMPIYLLTGMLNENFDGTQHILLDGTCRRPDQSRATNEMMVLWERKNLQVIVLKLSPKTARERLVARGRFDDAKDEAIESRFAWYEEHVVPSIEELRTLGWTIHEIDGEAGMEAVNKEILTTLGFSQ